MPTETQSQAYRETTGPGRVGPLSSEAKAGVVADLSKWLKHLLVRKLATDRAVLMQGHDAAAGLILAAEERLGKLESHLQVQNSAYQQRIQELTAALSSAKEENRALLLLQISQLKAEMESARAQAEEERSR